MIEADVCILGSGPAGLTLARRLIEQGMSVCILERGGDVARINSNDDSVKLLRRPYGAATDGRAIGLGGTSAFWGGQLLPLRVDEMQRQGVGDAIAWPISPEELERYFRTLETWLGVDHLSFSSAFLQESSHPAAHLDWGSISPRFSKWIPFDRRNLATSWKHLFAAGSNCRLFLHTVPSHIEFRQVGNATLLQCLTTTSKEMPRVHAARYVIAAGALESTCLLQKIVDASGTRFIQADNIGRYLHDHVSMRVGRVQLHDRKRFNQLFAPAFHGQTMHSIRIEVAPPRNDVSGIPSGYFHFVSEAPEGTGFAMVRDTLRALQSRNIAHSLHQFRRLPVAIPGILEILSWRYLRQRLPFGSDTVTWLYIDFEQPPLSANKVYAATPTDLSSQGILIDWDLLFDPSPALSFHRRELKAFWKRNGLDRVARVEYADVDKDADTLLNNMYDIYHPAGTTRMGPSAAEGVVDKDLRVFGFENLYVLSSGAFPSMGVSNPTFSLMALAMRLADHLGNP